MGISADEAFEETGPSAADDGDIFVKRPQLSVGMLGNTLCYSLIHFCMLDVIGRLGISSICKPKARSVLCMAPHEADKTSPDINDICGHAACLFPQC